HITQPQLAGAGFDTSGDARNLRLFVSGNEVAITVSRNSGPLGASDFIEFWGQGIDTPTTDTQVYWLINDSQPGLRLATKGELKIEDKPIGTSSLPTPRAKENPPSYLLSFLSPVVEPAPPDNQSREAPPPSRPGETKPARPWFPTESILAFEANRDEARVPKPEASASALPAKPPITSNVATTSAATTAPREPARAKPAKSYLSSA